MLFRTVARILIVAYLWTQRKQTRTNKSNIKIPPTHKGIGRILYVLHKETRVYMNKQERIRESQENFLLFLAFIS